MGFLIGESSDDSLPQPLPEITVDQSGSLNGTYSIEIPVGTKNVQPSLSISYNSNHNSLMGFLGIGWDLNGLIRISRDPIYTLQYTSSDHFISSLSGRLVQGNDGYYTSNPETLVKYFYDPNSDSWTAKDKEGNTYFFQTRIKALNGSNSPTYTWNLTSFSDFNGNSYTIDYVSNENNFTRYPYKIHYADREIEFQWKSVLNPISTYSYQTEDKDLYILESITIKASDTIIRKYNYDYTTDSFNRERLQKIRRVDYNESKTGRFYEIVASYKEFIKNIQFTGTQSLQINDTYALSRIPLPDKTECINGMLVCQQYAALTCNPAAGAGYFSCLNNKANLQTQCTSYKQQWEYICFSGINTPNSTIQPIDINGDGKLELTRIIGNELNGDIHIVSIPDLNSPLTQINVSDNLPNIQYKTFYTMGFADINGDGKTDFAYSNGTNLVVLYSNGNSFNPPIPMGNVSVPLTISNFLIDIPDTNWKGSLIDINGDGRADYVKNRDGQSIGIYFSQGNSFSNEVIANTGNLYEGKDLAQFIDMDGDGRPEIVHVVAMVFGLESGIQIILLSVNIQLEI